MTHGNTTAQRAFGYARSGRATSAYFATGHWLWATRTTSPSIGLTTIKIMRRRIVDLPLVSNRLAIAERLLIARRDTRACRGGQTFASGYATSIVADSLRMLDSSTTSVKQHEPTTQSRLSVLANSSILMLSIDTHLLRCRSSNKSGMANSVARSGARGTGGKDCPRLSFFYHELRCL